MNENPYEFRTVLRGYEPSEVDRVVTELTYDIGQAQLQVAALQRRIEQAGFGEGGGAEHSYEAPQVIIQQGAVSFADLGERIGHILTLAEEEANEIRANATSDITAKLAELETANAKARLDAEEYAADTRAGADREAAQIVQDAKRNADQLLDDAERHSTARREEAEAVYEQQRARAAQAAADFEQTLAERREKAETDFQRRTAMAGEQLKAAQQHVAQLRSETEIAAADAARKASQVTAESEQKAQQIVSDAMTRADRIRSESDRELSAATARRDSINAQLTNVRQMLATLTGTAPAGEEPTYPSPAGGWGSSSRTAASSGYGSEPTGYDSGATGDEGEHGEHEA